MGILADIGLAAGANASDAEQGLPLPLDKKSPCPDVRLRKCNQCQPDPAAIGKFDPAHWPENAILIDGFDNPDSTFGH